VREQRAAARILIADNHRLLADACKSMLEPDFAIVGIVTDGRDLIDAAPALKPDIIILNTSMPRLNGLDAGEQIKRKLPAIKLVFLTASLKADIVAEVFRRGASACVPMQAAGEELVIAIRKVNRGESYLSPLIATDTLTYLLSISSKQTLQREITQRQSEILQLLVEGMSMKQVANHIDVKPGTVAFHKYKMMETLNIKTSAELIGYAMKRQMLFA
jgi:DNA-binding NarL/FixJ family response regulator